VPKSINHCLPDEQVAVASQKSVLAKEDRGDEVDFSFIKQNLLENQKWANKNSDPSAKIE